MAIPIEHNKMLHTRARQWFAWPQPRKADLKCLHCSDCIPIDRASFFIPNDYDVYTDKYSGFGDFCGLSCCKAYLIYGGSVFSCETATRLMRLKEFAVRALKFNGLIKAAPPRLALMEHGGWMSREEFRQCIADGQLRFVVHTSAVITESMMRSAVIIEQSSRTAENESAPLGGVVESDGEQWSVKKLQTEPMTAPVQSVAVVDESDKVENAPPVAKASKTSYKIPAPKPTTTKSTTTRKSRKATTESTGTLASFMRPATKA